MSSAWGVFVRAFSSKIYVENMLHLGVLCLCFALNAIFIAPFMTNVERQGVRNPILVPHVHKIDFIFYRYIFARLHLSNRSNLLHFPSVKTSTFSQQN